VQSASRHLSYINKTHCRSYPPVRNCFFLAHLNPEDHHLSCVRDYWFLASIRSPRQGMSWRRGTHWIYWAIQEKGSRSWKGIALVTMRQEVHMNMCQIPMVTAIELFESIWISRPNSCRLFFVGFGEEQNKRKKYW